MGLGVLAFFLPLISIHAPIIGDVQWSSYNVVSEVFGSSKESDSPSFSKMVSRQESEPSTKASPSGADVPSSKAARDIPLGMRLAAFFPVAVLCCYIALAGTAFLLMFSYSPKAVVSVNTLGLVAAVYSLISIFLFDDALKTEMRRSMTGMESNPFAALGSALVASVHVQPGAGVYLLVGCFVFLSLVQYVTALDRLTLKAE